MNPAHSPKCVERSLLSKISCDYDAARPNTTSTCSKRCLLRLGEWMSLAAPPPEYPPWKTVYHYFRQWRINGTFEQLNAALRERLRICLGRNPQPSAGIADSQSAKSTGVGGELRGYDGGKKVRGRKRHLLVDTEGLV